MKIDFTPLDSPGKIDFTPLDEPVKMPPIMPSNYGVNLSEQPAPIPAMTPQTSIGRLPIDINRAQRPAIDFQPIVGAPAPLPGTGIGDIAGTYDGRTPLPEKLYKGAGASVAGMISGAGGAAKTLGFEDAGSPLNLLADTMMEKYDIPDKDILYYLAGGLGSMATFMLPGVGVARGAQAIAKVAPAIAKVVGASTMAVLESAVEGGSVYNRMKEKGADDKTARNRAIYTFAANMPANFIIDRINYFMPGKANVLKNALREGGQEMYQQVLSNTMAEDPATEGMIMSGIVGTIVGGGATLVQTGVQKLSEPPLPENLKQPPYVVPPTPQVKAETQKVAGITAPHEVVGYSTDGKPIVNFQQAEPTASPQIEQETAVSAVPGAKAVVTPEAVARPAETPKIDFKALPDQQETVPDWVTEETETKPIQMPKKLKGQARERVVLEAMRYDPQELESLIETEKNPEYKEVYRDALDRQTAIQDEAQKPTEYPYLFTLLEQYGKLQIPKDNVADYDFMLKRHIKPSKKGVSQQGDVSGVYDYLRENGIDIKGDADFQVQYESAKKQLDQMGGVKFRPRKTVGYQQDMFEGETPVKTGEQKPVEPAPLFEGQAKPKFEVPKLNDIIGNKYKDISFYASEGSKEITINKIVVPENKRDMGIGSNAMQDIIDYADRHNKTVKLTPSADFGGNKDRLISFYKNFGFKENKGTNKDFAISETMYRVPNYEVQPKLRQETAPETVLPEADRLDRNEERRAMNALRQIWGEGFNPEIVEQLHGVSNKYRDYLGLFAPRTRQIQMNRNQALASFLNTGGHEGQHDIHDRLKNRREVIKDFSTPEEYDELLKEADVVKRRSEDNRDVDTDEFMARTVGNYIETHTGVWGKFKVLLDKILNRIRRFMGAPSLIKEHLVKIAEGKVEVSGEAKTKPQTGRVRPELRSTKPDITRTENFRKWFGDSKVVDENGEPLIVYHGTEKGGFSTFSKDNVGQNTGRRQIRGFYFSENVLGASTYSGTKKEATISTNEDFSPKYDGEPGNYPVYLKMENPRVIDWQGKGWEEGNDEYFDIDDAAIQALDAGKDGVIINNIMDEGRHGAGYGWGERTFIVFEPTQIKSATGNVGTFDPENPDIRFSKRLTETEKTERSAAKIAKSDLMKEIRVLRKDINRITGKHEQLGSLAEKSETELTEMRNKMKEELKGQDELKVQIAELRKEHNISFPAFRKLVKQVTFKDNIADMELSDWIDVKNAILEKVADKTIGELTIEPEKTMKEGIMEAAGKREVPVKKMTAFQLIKKQMLDEAKGERTGKKEGMAEMKAKLMEAFKTDRKNINDTITYIKRSLPKEEWGRYIEAVQEARTKTKQMEIIERVDKLSEKVSLDSEISEIRKLSEPAKYMDLAYQDRLQSIVDNINLDRMSPAVIERLKRLRSYIDRHGEILELDKETVRRLKTLSKKSIKEFTPEAIRDLKSALEHVRHMGKLKLFLKNKHIQHVRMSNVLKLINSTHNFDIRETGNEALDDARNALLNFHFNTLHTARTFDEMDGSNQNYKGENVKLGKRISRAIQNAEFEHRNDAVDFIEEAGKIKNEWTEKEQRDVVLLLHYEQGAFDQVNQLMDEYGYDTMPEKTADYQKLMDIVRKYTGKNYARIAAVYEEIHNEHLGHVENYVPIYYEREETNSISVEDIIKPTRHRRTNVEQGFTRERQEGVKRIPRTDLFAIVDKALSDQTYYIHTQPELEDIKYIVKNKQYVESAGIRNAKFWADHLDIVARRGYSQEYKPNKLLKRARINLSKAVLGYKLSSVIMQPFAIFDALAYASAHLPRGASVEILKEFSKSLLIPGYSNAYVEQSPALLERRGGEMAIEEVLQQTSNSKKFYDKFITKGMKALQWADIKTAAGVQRGVENILRKHGTPNARQEAEFIMELVSSTNNIASRPHILSHGEVERTFLTFQNFFLNRWGEIIHDLILSGLIKSPELMKKLGALVGLGIIMLANMAENEARRGLYKLTHPGKDLPERPLIITAAMTIPSAVPIFGNYVDGFFPGGRMGNDIPVSRAVSDIFVGGGNLVFGKEPETKMKGLIKSARGVVGVGLGVPATYQVADIFSGMAEAPAKPKKEAKATNPDLEAAEERRKEAEETREYYRALYGGE